MDDMVAVKNENDPFHQMMLSLEPRSTEKSEGHQRRVKTALVIAFFMLGMGIDFNNSHIDEFWRPLGIDNVDDPKERRPFERLDYLVKTVPLLFYRGPVVEMANMMALQHEHGGKMNRGAFFDAMHSVNCYFAGNFITADTHFDVLKEHTETQAYGGIVLAKDYVSLHEKTYQAMSERRTT